MTLDDPMPTSAAQWVAQQLVENGLAGFTDGASNPLDMWLRPRFGFPAEAFVPFCSVSPGGGDPVTGAPDTDGTMISVGTRWLIQKLEEYHGVQKTQTH